MRLLILAHRYLGIGIGVLMIAWCLSGIIMMYVRYPEMSSLERLRHLQPMDWRGCCTVSDSSLADDAQIEQFQVEMLAGRPVLRAKLAHAGWSLVDLANGQALPGLSAHQAAEVAATFARAGGWRAQPQPDGVIDYDQWTVSGEFNAARPLFRFILAGPAGTRVYVSGATGKVVQLTTAHERFWNWLGAIPHWLYFAQLRRNTAAWAQVLIWTSLAGCFLTVLGIYLGVRSWLARPENSWSPYRGVLFWHHVPGLCFGLFALTWVASGLVSMNPWGLLDSAGQPAAIRSLQGEPLSGAQVKATVQALAAATLRPDVVSMDSAPLFGNLYLVVTALDGTRGRVDGTGASARLGSADWTKIVDTLGGKLHATTLSMLPSGDAYYYSRRGDDALLPAYRVVLQDAQQTRYYLDELSGTVIESFDSNARWYRWLHRGLHTLDFSAELRVGPAWEALMLVLLSGATIVCGTGTYLGLRRLLRMQR